MLNKGGRSAQSQTDVMHNSAILHARFEEEYSVELLKEKVDNAYQELG